MKPYYEVFPSLQYLYFEDSYVLGIVEQDPHLIFLMDAVLTEGHPSYAPPLPENHYCFKRLAIRFEGVSNVRWGASRFGEAYSTDSDGTVDYGNMDTLLLTETQAYAEGSWGEVAFTFSRLAVDYLEP